jgi:sugar lactone lactonase YvrE
MPMILSRSAHTISWLILAFGVAGKGDWLLAQESTQELLIQVPDFVSSLVFSPDGKTLVGGNHTGQVHLWEAATGKEKVSLDGPSGGVHSLAISTDGKLLAAGEYDKKGRVFIWDLATRKRLRTLDAHADGSVAVSFSPDGQILASAKGGVIKLWNTGTWKLQSTLKRKGQDFSSITFSADGRLLAAGSYNVDLWEMPMARWKAQLSGQVHDAPTWSNGLVFTPDSQTLVACSSEKNIQLWDPKEGKAVASLRGHTSQLASLAISANGKILASSATSGGVLLWDLPRRQEIALAETDPLRWTWIRGLALSPDGKKLALGGKGAVVLLDVAELVRRQGQVNAWLKNPPGFTPQEIEEMRKRIAALAGVESPDFGLSPTLQGTTFAPITGSEKVSVMLITNHKLKRSSAVLDLVKIGPRAIPFLLQALDDKTPTKLQIKPEGFLNYLGFPHDGGPYTVRVGDVCYVILGQILGANHQVVGYMPTATVIISSPMEDPMEVKSLRRTWMSDNPARHLHRTLLKKYQTGLEIGPSDGTELQIEATMRLLYYFPRESAPMIAERLKKFNVQKTNRDREAFQKREATNGVGTVQFLQSIAWCREPAVRAALQDIVKRTADPEIKAIRKLTQEKK